MNVKAVIIEKIDWERTSKLLTIDFMPDKGDMWIAFPDEYDDPRNSPFFFQGEAYQQQFDSKNTQTSVRLMNGDKFFEKDDHWFFKTIFQNPDKKQLTYYALYLPEYAVPEFISIQETFATNKQLKRTVYKDKSSNRYIIYLLCAERPDMTGFKLDCRFKKDEEGFERANYDDAYQSSFYGDAEQYRYILSQHDNGVAQQFLAEQVIINNGTFNQARTIDHRQNIQNINQHSIMAKGTERLIVFIMGVVFICTILLIALFIPEPKPFQWNVFKTIIALSGAGIAAFIPGFIEVEISKFVRAGGALAIFVLLYFYNPAGLVVDYRSVSKKYDLMAFDLGQDVTTTDIVLNQVTEGDSSQITAVKNNAKKRLEVIQGKADQLDLKINLTNVFETTGATRGVFAESKYDYIISAINNVYSKKTVDYFRVGWYLTFAYVQGSIVTDPESIRKHPEFLEEYKKVYAELAPDLNADLQELGYQERLPETFTTIADVQQKAMLARSKVKSVLNKE